MQPSVCDTVFPLHPFNSDILEDPTVTRTLHVWTICPSAASKVQHSTTPGCINGCRCCWNATGRKAAFTREGVVVISSFTQLLLRWMSFCRRLTGRLAAATFLYICLSTAQLAPFVLCTRAEKEENRKRGAEVAPAQSNIDCLPLCHPALSLLQNKHSLVSLHLCLKSTFCVPFRRTLPAAFIVT